MRWFGLFAMILMATGCLDRDVSTETLTIDVAAGGPFSIGVPVPVSESASFEDWKRNARVEGNATLDASHSERGWLLNLEGSGHAELRATVSWTSTSGVAEKYLDATWTASNHSEEIYVLLHAGPDMRLTIRYEAESKYCGRDDLFEADAPRYGWNSVSGTREAICQ